MANAVAKTEEAKQTSPVATVRAALEQLAPQMQLALPKHLSVERLTRVTMTAIQNTPKLLDCDRTSLFSAVMSCAQLGLEPDGILGQAYLIPFGKKVQFIPGYKGLISLARNSGDVVSISAHEVYELDHFDFAFGLNERLEHIPSREADRGEVIFFYAIAKFKDGGHHFEVLPVSEVEAIRDGSQGYKAAVMTAKKYNKPEVISPWVQSFCEMGKKTAIRRMAKFLPLSVQKAAHLADSYDTGTPSHLDKHGDIVIEGPVQDQESITVELDNSKLDELEKTINKADEKEDSQDATKKEEKEEVKADDDAFPGDLPMPKEQS